MSPLLRNAFLAGALCTTPSCGLEIRSKWVNEEEDEIVAATCADGETTCGKQPLNDLVDADHLFGSPHEKDHDHKQPLNHLVEEEGSESFAYTSF